MRKETKLLLVVVLLFSTLLGSIGQLLFKLGLTTTTILLYLLLGFLAYALSTVLYLYALGRMHLSWAYGMGGLSYVFASILALLILGEQISPLRWLGILVIAIGAALVGLS